MKRVLKRIRSRLVCARNIDERNFSKIFRRGSPHSNANNCVVESPKRRGNETEEKQTRAPSYVTFFLSFSFFLSISLRVLVVFRIFAELRSDLFPRESTIRRDVARHGVHARFIASLAKEEILQERQTPSGVCKYNRFEGCACTSPGVFSTRQT